MTDEGGKTLRGPWPDPAEGAERDPVKPGDVPQPASQTELGLESAALVDQVARDRVRSSLDESLLVEAAAGTGKTTELIHRLVAVLASGRATIDGIVAVTFTRKAAGELKLRLRQELDRARSATPDDLERASLEHAVAHLEEARIGTIHSLCAEILRRLPIAAGVDPSFVELSEEEAPALHSVAFEKWIQRRLADPSPQLRRALVHLAVSPFGRESVLDRLRSASWALADWRDFPAVWSRPEYDREELLGVLVEGVMRLASWARLSGNRRDSLRRALEPVVTLQTWIRRRGAWPELDRPAGSAQPLPLEVGLLAPTDSDAHDELEARLIRLARDLKAGRPAKGAGRYAEGVTREQLWEARAKLLTGLETLKRVAQADLAASTKEELDGVIEEYEQLKRSRGSVDYTDLLLRARDLIRDDAVARRQLQVSFSHLFVDEFQDTDPLQAEILLLLCADDSACSEWREVRPVPGKLFVVGDPKQSIYRFRRADIGLYAEVKEHLADQGVGVVHLTSSFRSTAPIQKLVNACFAGIMDGDVAAGHPEYVALDPVRPASPSQPGVVVLPAPYPYGSHYVTRKNVEECQPAAAAAFIDWLVHESGWTVEDPQQRGCPTPVRPEHVCLLFRRFVSWGRETTREYTRALEARGLTHLLVGARTLHRREEVETLRSVLQAVEWPNDELALYATLRGSLFAFSDEALLRFRDLCGSLDAFRWSLHRQSLADYGATQPGGGDIGELEEIVSVLELLLGLHHRRNHRPIVETVRQLLHETRAHAGFAMRPAGNQVLANVERVLDLARGYELGGGRSFRGFVERLDGESSRPRSSQPVVVEDGAPGVRLMTVHNAKGLEFPVVVLADMTANLASREPDRTIDAQSGLCASRLLGWKPQDLIERSEAEHVRDESEGARVAYVAATRARDLLVIPAVGDKALEGWLSPLTQGIYPAAKAWRQSEAAAGCPRMGKRSVVERPPEMEDGIESSVRPGLHRLGGKKSSYDVVWWDPCLLDLSVSARFGLRQEEILSEDEGAVEVERNLERYRAWREGEAKIRAKGGRASVELVRVTELEVDPPSTHRVQWQSVERVGERPSGVRFGSLVHVVLQLHEAHGEMDGGQAAIEQLARQQGRLLEATEAEIFAAAAAVSTARQHPLLKDARRSARVCREMPFTLPLGAGAQLAERSSGDQAAMQRVLEGTIDLAFLDPEEERWIVVDFKTDLEFGEQSQGYERQVAWYCHALEQLTGLPAAGFLLAV